MRIFSSVCGIETSHSGVCNLVHPINTCSLRVSSYDGLTEGVLLQNGINILELPFGNIGSVPVYVGRAVTFEMIGEQHSTDRQAPGGSLSSPWS